MNPSKLESTMKAYGLTDTSIPLIELSRNQGPDVHGKPLNNLTDSQLADAVRMVLRSDIMLETICCAARDRIMLLSLQVEMRTRERDEAIHEASRRDQKWMDGIDEICGWKLSYKHDPSDSSAYTLQDFINQLRTANIVDQWSLKASDEMAKAVLYLIDEGMMDPRSRVADAHLMYCAARTGASGDEVNAFRKMVNPSEESR